MKTFNQNSLSLGLGMDPGPPEYEAGVVKLDHDVRLDGIYE
jgi:hypothetical protein